MERVDKTIEVECPVSIVYNQWTQFEAFPQFMAGVKEVEQLDATHVRWHAELWGKEELWDAEITEQTPDERISWRSINGAHNTGTVRFEPVGPTRTRTFWFVARNYALEDDDEKFVRFQQDVVAQDRPIIESQRPHRIPFALTDELHVRDDKVVLAYRRALIEYAHEAVSHG